MHCNPQIPCDRAHDSLCQGDSYFDKVENLQFCMLPSCYINGHFAKMAFWPGVQNMCQRVSTAARHFFEQALLHNLRDFYTILRDFT